MTHVRGAGWCGGEWSSCGETTGDADADGTEVATSTCCSGAHPSASAGIWRLGPAKKGPSSLFIKDQDTVCINKGCFTFS